MAQWLVAAPEEQTVLERALRSGRCYTSVLNATEILAACTSDEERHAAAEIFRIVRVLGFPARSALVYAASVDSVDDRLKLTSREMMILGLAQESKLTILTEARYDRYRALNVVQVARSGDTASAIEV